MECLPLRDMGLSTLIQRLAARIAGKFDGSSESSDTRRVSSASGSPAAFATYIRDAAARYDVPEDLVQAVIQSESNFQPDAVSQAGAKGLMQLMDGTARSLGVNNSLDPRQNIEGGVRYLHNLISRYQSIPLALAAYNAGPGAVDKYGGIPPYAETQTYVKRVMSLCDRNWEA